MSNNWNRLPTLARCRRVVNATTPQGGFHRDVSLSQPRVQQSNHVHGFGVAVDVRKLRNSALIKHRSSENLLPEELHVCWLPIGVEIQVDVRWINPGRRPIDRARSMCLNAAPEGSFTAPTASLLIAYNLSNSIEVRTAAPRPLPAGLCRPVG